MNINIDFDKLKETAKDLAQTSVARAKDLTDTAIAKGKELTEIGKLKVQNASEADAIKKAYLELGKLYFAERGAAPEPAYAALCEKISQSQAKIEYNNERIADIKAAGNLSDEEIQDVEVDIHDAAAEDHADDSCAAMTSLRSNQTNPPSSKFGRGGFSLRTGVRLNQKIFP